MVNTAGIYAIAEGYFTLHLLAPGEADVAHEGGEGAQAPDASEGSAGGAQAGAESPADAGSLVKEAGQTGVGGQADADGGVRVLPENLVEDFIDEIADMFEEVHDLHSGHAGWENALVFGFVDGALAVANDTWSSYEDSYFESVQGEHDAFIDEIDAAIDEIADDFEGERPWDEAAKGYIRSLDERYEGGLASADKAVWATFAHAFMYGADAAYDMEWKFVVTPAGNVMLTDEDSISEAALAQIEAESGPGGGSLLGRVFDMMGIDLDELTAAIGDEEDSRESEIVVVKPTES